MVIAVLDRIGKDVIVQKYPLFSQYSRQYGKKINVKLKLQMMN